MFSALSTAGDFHPEALNVMDMQWMPLSKIAEMLNSPRPRPPRRSAKAIREAMLGDREAAGGSQGTPGAGTGPGQANSPGGASVSKRPARGRPAENQAGLHFVAWQILRSNNVLGWLVAQSRAHSNNAAGEEGGQAKVLQDRLEALFKALIKRGSKKLAEQYGGAEQPRDRRKLSPPGHLDRAKAKGEGSNNAPPHSQVAERRKSPVLLPKPKYTPQKSVLKVASTFKSSEPGAGFRN